MDALQLNINCAAALNIITRGSTSSPLGHVLRRDIAAELGMSFQDALAVLDELRKRGDIVTGETLNDFWAKPAPAEL
jgi:hypothetical protein